MKKEKIILNVLIILLCLVFTPKIVNATNASANNWKLFCEETVLTPSGTTNCYLIAQITDATSGDKNISAVLTKVSTEKAEIVDAKAAFNYMQLEKTLPSARFSNTLHGSKTNCDSTGTCYDFTSASGIVSNPSDSKIVSKGFTGYTPIGYWTVKLDANQITSDTDCGKICVYTDYIVDGQTATGNVVVSGNNNVNAPCIEINLKTEAEKVCYCNGDVCYGKNGTEVTKEQYEAECDNKKICREENGKYYGKDGSEITKEQYEKDCIPKTGSFASYAVLAAGALIALSAITIAKKHNKFYRV